MENVLNQLENDMSIKNLIEEIQQATSFMNEYLKSINVVVQDCSTDAEIRKHSIQLVEILIFGQSTKEKAQ